MQILTWVLRRPDSGECTTCEINKNLFLTQTMTSNFNGLVSLEWGEPNPFFHTSSKRCVGIAREH